MKWERSLDIIDYFTILCVYCVYNWNMKIGWYVSHFNAKLYRFYTFFTRKNEYI